VVSLCCPSLHDFYFFFGQAVEVIDELVDLFVGGVDLTPDFVLGCETGGC
jgi:hypothetical protein